MNKVLKTTKFVIDKSAYVKIRKEKIKEFCKNFDHKNKENIKHWLDEAPFKISILNDEDRLNFLLVLNSISFCYWREPKWNIDYRGNNLDGAYGMIAALGRGVKEGKLILKAEYLANISKYNLANILAGNTEIPLLEERWKILRKVGETLNRGYNREFVNLVKYAKGDALDLLNLLLKNFSSFQDFANYKGKKIYFYKKAQLLVADIYQGFKGERYGNLKNVGLLTACADYKLPQILRKLDILEYSKELTYKVDNKVILDRSGEEEIEIRANTIWAVEYVKRELRKKIPDIKALHINDHLWLLTQKKYLDDKPYHRTMTTAY